jgi:hypothetical protein
MRPRLACLAAAMLILALPATVVLAADPPAPGFGGPIDGAQEVPAVATTATGDGTVVVSADDTTITYIVTYSGLSGPAVAAHIHTGTVGVNGGIILPLAVGPSPMVGTLTAADFTPAGAITTFAEAVAAIKAGATYINIHTAANPGGEIRGQVAVKGDVFFASLAGFQEVPAVDTTASGDGWVLISTDESAITFHIAFSGLSGPPVAAHIHLGGVGANGGVMLPFTAGPSPMFGVLTAADLTPTGSVTDFAGAVAAIIAGGTYMNMHTAANPGGEIRGQLAETVAAPAPSPSPSPAPTTAASAAPTSTATPPPTSTEATPGAAGGGWAGLVLILIGASLAGAIAANRIAGRRSRG